MAKSIIARGSFKGPKGDTGAQGIQGVPGRTFDPEGTVATKADLASMSPAPAKGKAWVVVANKHLYVYEGDEAPTSGTGYDAAVPGWTDMGDIQGPKGDTGATGSQGIQGATGAQGPQGVKGDTGAQGATGPKGDTGAQGATGPKGDTGTQGAQGIQGVKGDTGTAGAKGDTGAQGPQGIQGNTGPQGAAGSKWYGYGGTTGRTQAQALALAAINDWLINTDNGDYFEVADI